MIRLRVPDGLGSTLRAWYGRSRGRRLVHFLHVGKTGGTALKYALGRHWTTSEYGLVFHGHRYKLRDVPPGDQAVFFLREPISRFVSGFYSRLRQGQPRYRVPWTAAESRAFKRFTTPNQLALGLSSTNAERRAHATEAMRSIGHVRAAYPRWLQSEAYVIARLPDILFMGFQETLSSDFDRLVSKLGLTNQVQLPSDDRAAHRGIGDFDKRLDPEAVENLRRWYEADLRLYELCRRLANQTSSS